MRVLVVDDEKLIRDVIKEYLLLEKIEVDEASNGEEAVDKVKNNNYDIIIMDIMMPKMDGYSACREIKKIKDIPFIMLSARGEEYDKLIGFDLGIDDYVTKPFRPLELLARVNSQLRRYSKFLNMVKEPEVKENIYSVGGLELNFDTKEVAVDEKPVKLTPIEFKILALLIKNPGRVFAADEIYERVWNEQAINTDTIMVHIRKIREKIEINPKNPKYLKVVWGVGYKIEKQ